jgi:hypothetical protein
MKDERNWYFFLMEGLAGVVSSTNLEGLLLIACEAAEAIWLMRRGIFEMIQFGNKKEHAE